MEIFEKHLPLKKKFIRGNQAPFMKKKTERDNLQQKYAKKYFFANIQPDQNEVNYKKQHSKRVSLRKKSVQLYFQNILRVGIITNRSFWSTTKPFPTNNGHINSNEIIVKNRNKAIIKEDREFSETFSDNYVNTVQITSGKKPTHVARGNNIFGTD